MREKILKELRDEYERLQQQDELDTERRIAGAMEKCKGLRQLLEQRQNLIYDSLRGILNGNGSADDIPDRMQALNTRIGDLLAENGLARNELEPGYHCDLCRDKGYTGDPVREMCSCMKKRYQEKLREEIGLSGSAYETFDHYDETLLSDEPLKDRSYSQRFLTGKIKKMLENWVKQYPDCESRDLLLMGKTGLGKTFLMHAMAEALLKKNVNILFIGSYQFIDIVRRSWFGGNGDELQELKDAGVLFLDDLGSEPLLQNVTIEQLYMLINERQSRNLSTVISTNLTQEEFRERYTERIASRLMDTRNSMVFTLQGNDLRHKEKRN